MKWWIQPAQVMLLRLALFQRSAPRPLLHSTIFTPLWIPVDIGLLTPALRSEEPEIVRVRQQYRNFDRGWNVKSKIQLRSLVKHMPNASCDSLTKPSNSTCS